MKVLFILNVSKMFERLGPMCLSGVLKPQGHDVRLLFTWGLSGEEILSRVRAFSPGVIAYSIMTGEEHSHLRINRDLKRHLDFFAVFGGPHPTFNPDLIGEAGVDAVCVGEGDYAFRDMLAAMEEGRDFTRTKNFRFKTGGKIVVNDLAPLIENLDELPLPDRALASAADSRIGADLLRCFAAMRGCPYPCTYCFNHVYNAMMKGKGSMLRYRSVSGMIREFRAVQKDRGLTRALVVDDTFLIKPPGWLEEFAERFPREVGIGFLCNIRPNLASRRNIRQLKRAGCRGVFMGVETGDNEAAEKVLKRRVSNETIVQAAQELHRQGIRLITQNLVGLPVDDPLSVDMKTLDLNLRLRPSVANARLVYPYPKTELAAIAARAGLLERNAAEAPHNTYLRTAIRFKEAATKRRIENLAKLFSLVVAFPILRPLVPLLIRLPFSRLYSHLFLLRWGSSAISLYFGWEHFARNFPRWIIYYLHFLQGRRKPAYPASD
ncbi:MAG: radical SAM protein [Elusimicrobiota bacterium]